MIKKAIVTIHCHGINCGQEKEVDLLGWEGEFDVEADGHWLFCQECQGQKPWFDAQCPGCVECFPDCALGKSFHFSLASGPAGRVSNDMG